MTALRHTVLTGRVQLPKPAEHQTGAMSAASGHTLFSMLPERPAPWKEFGLSMGAQSLALLVLAWVGVLHPEVLTPPLHDYHFVRLVNTPPPINHEPAPVRLIQPPAVAHLEPPSPKALRLPPEVRPKPQEDVPAPKVEIATVQPLPLLPAAPVMPRQMVKTNVFSTGSSAPPTTAQSPQQVQTGGFGDPNGVPAQDSINKPVTIAQKGSYDLPSGPGYGNGTGGARGIRGVVASAGFGNGVATADSNVHSSRGAVRQSGFGDAEPVTANQVRPKPAPSAPRMLPAEIISKPTPIYTGEARKLHIEGEVLLEVVFESSGKIRVLRVVQGLGHGLDELGPSRRTPRRGRCRSRSRGHTRRPAPG